MEDKLLAVTGVGMVSPLGIGLAGACAAARAGINRAAELDFKVVNSEDNQPEAVTGCEIPHLTKGFEGIGRILRITQTAFVDLVGGGGLSKIKPNKCGMLIVMPDPLRCNMTFIDKDVEYSNPYLPAPFELETVIGWIYELCKGLNFEIERGNIEILLAWHTGFFMALAKGIERLNSREWDSFIVGSIDSMVGSETLQWLLDHNRLKCGDNPSGLQPSEAGVFMVIQRQSDTIRQQTAIHAIINGFTTGYEPDHFFTRKVSTGKGLSETASSLIKKLKGSVRSPWIVSDINGEAHRSNELGYTLVRLASEFPGLKGSEILYPAISFGDTGAASVAVGICMTIRAFERNYAPSNEVFVFSSADNGDRSAMCITKPS